ncbi:javelin-like isoform X2 [Arctopsyche grandis]
MECLQLRSPSAPFHYHISDQAKSLVALQELQNEVGALLEFRDLVIETFPNLRSKLASGGVVGSGSGGGTRRDWEPGVRVRRKLPTRDPDSLPRSRSDSHSKPPTKGDGAHSVVQDSGFSTETSSSKEAHSAQAAPQPRAPAYEPDLWQLLDVIQVRGARLRDDADTLRAALNDRRSHSLNALCSQERDPSEEFRRTLAAGSVEDIDALRRERDLLLDRLAELEAETLAGRVEAEGLRNEGNLRLALDRSRDYEEHRTRPSAPGPMRTPIRSSVFAPVTPVKSVNNISSSSPLETSSPIGSDSEGEGDVSSAFETELGKLDNVMNTPVRHLKVKTPDTRKFAAILRENNPIELQRHLLKFTVLNQILQDKLEKVGNTKGSLVERLHRTREENDDLRFQLEEKTIELEGSRAHVRLLENSGQRLSSSAPRSMRALQPLPLHLQLDEDVETEAEVEPETSPVTEIPRRKPSKIPLPPSKQPTSGLVPKPPTGRSKDNPSYRSRSGDSLGRPGSSQSWRNKSDINSLSGSKSANSISSTKCPNGGRNTSFVTIKSSAKESINRYRDSKHSRDSLTGKVRNNDSLSRIRDSNLSHSNSVLSSSKKDLSGSMTSSSSKKSSVPVRRASSSSSMRTGDPSPKVRPSKNTLWSQFLKLLDNGPS